MRSVPKPAELVGVKDRVVAENGNVFRLALRYEYPVKRILVRTGEQSRASGVRRGDWKRFKRFLEKDLVEAESEVGGLG